MACGKVSQNVNKYLQKISDLSKSLVLHRIEEEKICPNIYLLISFLVNPRMSLNILNTNLSVVLQLSSPS